MAEEFKIQMETDNQTVKADCCIELGRFLYLTMTAPYNGIETMVRAFDEDGEFRQFYDLQEAREYAINELHLIMEQIKWVKQYRSEYADASDYFQRRYSQLMTEFRITEAAKQRGWLTRQMEITHQAFGEYMEMINELVPMPNRFYIINPGHLAQILAVI